jgi:hypothetical protein
MALGFAGRSFAIGFNAGWEYRLDGGEDRETSTEFRQRYGIGGLSQALSAPYQPTRAVTFTPSVSYTRRQGLKTLAGSSDTLIPLAQLSLINDIFKLQLSGTTTHEKFYNSGAFVKTGQDWSSSLASNGAVPLWPSLLLNYSERTDDVNDQASKQSSMYLNWKAGVTSFSYQYSKNQAESPNSESLSVKDSHFARLESKADLFDKRLSLNFAQQFLYTSTDVTLAGGEVYQPLSGSVLYKDFDNPDDPENDPTKPECLPVQVADLDDCYDPPGNSIVPPVTVEQDQTIHLAVSSDFAQQIDRLRLTLTGSLSAMPGDKAEKLKWKLYTRDPDDSSKWVSSPDIITAVFSDSRNTLDLSVGQNTDEILVVATIPAGGPLEIDAVEFYAGLTQEQIDSNQGLDTTTNSYLTNLGMRYRFSRTLSASANLTLEHAGFESGLNSTVFNSDHRFLSSSLRWNPTPYLTPTIGFSENLYSSTGEDDEVDRSYTLSVRTVPLEKIDATVTTALTESYSGDQKTSSLLRYGLNTSALIYPDLTTSWYIGVNHREVLEGGDDFSRVDMFFSRLSLDASLSRKLNADITTDYSKQDREDGSRKQAGGVVALTYHASELLGLAGKYTTELLNSETATPDSISLSLYLTVLRNQKTRLSLNTGYLDAGGGSKTNFGLAGSWDISRQLAFRGRANYNIAESNVYNFASFLDLRL